MFMFSSFFFLALGFMICLFVVNPTFYIMWLIILSFFMGLIFLHTLNSWITYAVILLFTGGMMVLFTYMTSLTSQTKINFPTFPKIYLSLWFIMIFTFSQNYISLNYSGLINSLFYVTSFSFLLFMMSYLLLVLLSMVKMASSISGPMKSFFKNEK